MRSTSTNNRNLKGLKMHDDTGGLIAFIVFGAAMFGFGCMVGGSTVWGNLPDNREQAECVLAGHKWDDDKCWKVKP